MGRQVARPDNQWLHRGEQIEQSARAIAALNQEVILWLERAAQDFRMLEAWPPAQAANGC
jgi:hypothetical protein